MVNDRSKEMAERAGKDPDSIVRGRKAADVLIEDIIKVLTEAKLKDFTDAEVGMILRDVITDLKDIRQNVLRWRKVQRTEN